MDTGILKIKLFNAFIVLIVAAQLVLSVYVIAFMLASSTGMSLTLEIVASFAFLVFLCMPISIYLFITSKDRVLRTLFAGMSLSFGLMTASGILIGVVPMVYQAFWISPLSQILMLASYVPILCTLGWIVAGVHKKPGALHEVPTTFY